MIEETQRGGRFQHFSAVQLHAVVGVGRGLVEDAPQDLPEHDAGLEAAPGEDGRSDVARADTDKPEKAIALGFEHGCMLTSHW